MKLKHLLTHTGKNSFAIAIAELQNAQTVLRWLLQLCNSLKQFCDGYCSLAKASNSFAMVIASLQKAQTVLLLHGVGIITITTIEYVYTFVFNFRRDRATN